MAKKPARVPELQRQHHWVVLGNFELELSEFAARRIVEAPEDTAVPWREQATLLGVHGPGCSECGIHAKEGLGHACEGQLRLKRLQEEGGQTSSKIAIPGRDF